MWLYYSAGTVASQAAALTLKLLLFHPLCITYPKLACKLLAWS